MSMIALGPDADTKARLSTSPGEPPDALHLTLVMVPTGQESPTSGHVTRVEKLAQVMADQLPPATGTVSGETTFRGGSGLPAHVALISIPGMGLRRAELARNAKMVGVPLAENFDFLPHVTRSYGVSPRDDTSGQPVRFDHVIVANGDDPSTWRRYPLRGVAKFGAFNPDLHPHGWHGYWSMTGGRKVREIGTKGNRQRVRTGSGQNYNRNGTRQPIKTRDNRRGFGARGTGGGSEKPRIGAKMNVTQGQGAAAHVVTATVAGVQTNDTEHVVTLNTPTGTRTARIPHAGKAPGFKPAKTHPARGGGFRLHPSGYVNHQAIRQWWNGRRSSFSGQLPSRRSSPRQALGRPGKPVHKDAMTVSADLGHEGQSPVTIMQGGSQLSRCPECGYKLASDGHCPKHGNVLKADVGGDQPPIPSHGENLPGPTVNLPKSRRGKRPKQNEPVGPTGCPDCGGTDGFHASDCPRQVLNPGGGPVGLGA